MFFQLHAVMEEHTGSWDARRICADFDGAVRDLTAWKQLERQELLFAWWLISDQQTRSQWGRQMKALPSTLKLSFRSFLSSNFCSPASKISPLAHPPRTLSSIAALSIPPLTLPEPLLAVSFAFPHFHHCRSLPFLPRSLLPLLRFRESRLYQGVWIAQVHWKRRQWAHHHREAEPMKEEQRPQPKRGPSPLAPRTVCVCVDVLGKQRVHSCLCRKAGAAPWDFAIMDLPPPEKAPWLSAIILKQAAFSCWRCASIIVWIYRSAWSPVHSCRYVSRAYVY